MSNFVTELRIIDGAGGNLFDTDKDYVIPLYQRAYAWEDKQLIQLIEDINDIPDGIDYRIGSLIVSEQNGKYEVVDGQQRLTSLYLLLNCLGIKTQQTLTFACRAKSNYTLKNIGRVINTTPIDINTDELEQSIYQGVRIISRELTRADIEIEDFKSKLERVILYRIEVPKNTDLNRYFEIMNTRGEQLEQHDILKAKLMSYLSDDGDKHAFATIWDACSDMTGYVQMHLVSPGNAIRNAIFGEKWKDMPSDKWADYRSAVTADTATASGCKIADIVIASAQNDADGYNVDGMRVRFESVIEFPYFLLHVLKVYVKARGIKHKDESAKITDELLDDKKLISAFERVVEHGVTPDGKKITADMAGFARDFAVCLLRTRFLFDKYILKREYANENLEGQWSLKSLHISNDGLKKPYYKNSKFTVGKEWATTNDKRTKENIMIQSALRVSYTSPKVMHWITELLIWLSDDGNPDRMKNFSGVAEKLAASAVNSDFFDKCPDGKYSMGVSTPHIVFNFLDYLLWRDGEKYADFTFEFRNSVEHWYPQNPSEENSSRWEDVDTFGNLCIIQRNVNSKFSNLPPEGQKSSFAGMIAKGSIKLCLMSEATVDHAHWRSTAHKEHENKMIEKLKEACARFDSET